jgi:hypothetical protein
LDIEHTNAVQHSGIVGLASPGGIKYSGVEYDAGVTLNFASLHDAGLKGAHVWISIVQAFGHVISFATALAFPTDQRLAAANIGVMTPQTRRMS